MKRIASCVLALIIVVMCNAQTLTADYLKTAPNGKGTFTEYVARNGDVYKIGDTIVLGKAAGDRNYYKNIRLVDVMGTSSDAIEVVDATVVIKKVKIYGNKKVGFKCSLQTTSWTDIANLYIGIEDALAAKEVKTDIPTSDEALEMLKKEKDKLDLGLITQEEFDAEKERLRVYIK